MDFQKSGRLLMPIKCSDLISENPGAWEHATKHPFLDECQSGEIKADQFNTWLVQDYLFVIEFTRMAAHLVTIAPIRHLDVLLGGLSALKDELNWFREKAEERSLKLAAAQQETCESYCRFMRELRGDAYPVQAVAFWAIESAYNQAWQLPGPMAPPYDEFANRWGNAVFTEYVRLLEIQANEALTDVDPETEQRTREVFSRIADLERGFWQMAYWGDA
jgi:thiaminase/transcriptional activator TenA